MITLPANFIADVTTAVGANLSALAPILVVVVGLPVGFWIVKRVIGLFPKTK